MSSAPVSLLRDNLCKETLSARYRQPPAGLFYRYKSRGTRRKPETAFNLLEVVRPGPHIRRAESFRMDTRGKRRRKTAEILSGTAISEGLAVLRQLNGVRPAPLRGKFSNTLGRLN